MKYYLSPWYKRLLIPLFALLTSHAGAEPRQFTSTDGKSITATVLAIRGDQVVLAMGAKQYTLPVSRFSSADQEYFIQWKEDEAKNRIPRLEVDVSSGKSNRLDTADQFDDRKGSFQFSIKITNEERDYDLTDASADLVVIGENCELRNHYAVMDTSNFKVSVLEGETFEWSGDKMSYRFDDSEPSRWGHDYYGYVLQIKNSSGKVIFTKTIPKKFEGEEEKIFAFKKGTAFDSEMKHKGQASIYKD